MNINTVLWYYNGCHHTFPRVPRV